MTRAELVALVEQAMLAPSVHNVQPARWRIEDDALALFEDVNCRLRVGDPKGNDAGISLGAAAEGLRLAAGLAGFDVEDQVAPVDEGSLRGVARYRLTPGGAADPLAALVDARRSWRGDFARATDSDRTAADALASEDAAIVSAPDALTDIATLFDAASFGFMRDAAFRAELRSWMRLSRRHPRWDRDGLNAEAMALGRVEAFGAGIVLGPAFAPLDRIGLAARLLAEGGKIADAAAVVLFHRPRDEAPFDSGRHFYRLWLRIEAAGFGTAVLAALADDLDAARTVSAMGGVPDGNRLVSAFRIGRRPAGKIAPRSRRPIAEVLV